MQQQTPYYKLYLREELARRCEHNPSYSLRSFARALEIDPAVLSRTLGDKRAMSYKVATRIIDNLCLSPKERDIFLESVAEDQKQRGLRRSFAQVSPLSGASASVGEIDAEIFRIIGDWYHYAIQQLSLVDHFQSDPKWIARQLGITVLETKFAIQRLIAVGLLAEVDGRLMATHSSVDTKDKTSSTPALRKYQKQILTKAIYALENDPLPRRSVSSMTMPIDADKLPLARRMIQEFTNNLCDVLGSGKRSALYQLSISFFPLERMEDEPK
jgi:uncharacterized protein (TIGR02147 family)